MRGAKYTPPDPVETPPAPAPVKRARKKTGQFLPDDPSTPDTNEAWEPKHEE